MLLNLDNFVGQFTIGQKTLNAETLQWYIDTFEPKFFEKYFKDGYYKSLNERLTDNNLEVKSAAENELKKISYPLTAYVWNNYISNEQEQATGDGIAEGESNNSKKVDIEEKCRRVYNDMIESLLNNKENTNIKIKMLRFNNFLGL